MAWLGDLLVRLRAETADFQQDMGKAAHVTEQSMRRVKNATNFAVAGLSVGGVGLLAKGIIDTADGLGKLSQKVGVTVEDLSKLQYAAELGDVDVQTFAKGMRDFNRSLVEAGDSSSKTARLFKALGVDITAGPTEAFRQFADQFARLPEGELRTAAAMQILKKAGAEFIPVIADGTRGLNEAAEQATRLGLVISTDFSKKAQKFNDNMKILEKSSKAGAQSLTEGAIPAFVEITDQIVKGAERGEKWLSFMREVTKVSYATAAAILPSWTAAGAAAKAAADHLFKPLPKGNSLENPVKGKIGGLPEIDLKSAPDPEAVRNALASNEAAIAALQKRQIEAIQSMEEKRKGLLGLTEEQVMMERVLGGTYAEFDSNTKVRLLNLAIEIDGRKQLIERIDEQAKATEEIFARTQALAAEKDSQREADRLSLESLRFETSLIGIGARDQERLTALRQIDLETRQRILRVAELLKDTEDGGAAELGEVIAQGERQKRAFAVALTERQQLERDWVTGARASFTEYEDIATNAALMTRDLFTNAFRGMEDALVDFAKSGKLNFKSLADSIISDLIRIQIRQSIMVPLTKSMNSGSFLDDVGGFLGIGSGNPSSKNYVNNIDSGELGSILGLNSFAAGTDYVPNDMIAQIHKGERIVPAAENRGGDGSGHTFYVDMRGASQEAVESLKAFVLQINASIEPRAVSAMAGRHARRLGR